MSPVAPIAHLIAIAAGVLGGLWLSLFQPSPPTQCEANRDGSRVRSP